MELTDTRQRGSQQHESDTAQTPSAGVRLETNMDRSEQQDAFQLPTKSSGAVSKVAEEHKRTLTAFWKRGKDTMQRMHEDDEKALPDSNRQGRIDMTKDLPLCGLQETMEVVGESKDGEFEIKKCKGFDECDDENVKGVYKTGQPEASPNKMGADQFHGANGSDGAPSCGKSEEMVIKETAVGEKKRKRAPLQLSEQIVEGLEILYTQCNAYPTSDQKNAFASENGIEVNKITNWMERRRRKARAAGLDVSVKKTKKPKESDSVSASGQNLEGDAQFVVDKKLVETSLGISIGELETELHELRVRGLSPPLYPLPVGKEGTMEYSEENLCMLLVGQRSTLSELVQLILPLFSVNQPTPDALRSCIIDLAARRSYDPVNNSLKSHQTLEWTNNDIVGGGMWQWEVRDKESLHKVYRAQAAAIKKRATKIGNRVKAILTVLDEKTYAKGENHANTAFETFKNTSPLEKIEMETKAESSSVMTKEEREKIKAEKQAEKLKRQQEKELAKQLRLKERQEREEQNARIAAEKKMEKERLRAEKEAERERLRAEKEAEKERLKAQKEAQRLKKMEESKIQKLAKKTGFEDTAVLNKTANKFMVGNMLT